MSVTFFSYRRWRWFWINVVFVLLLTVIYFIDQPVGGRSGSTWVGFIYGFIALAGILYLMWYGKRKQSYSTSSTTLLGCLSAHVWLGVSLAIIVPLHAGFQLGLNIHSLAYILMMLVITSGIYGATKYITLAPLIAAHRGGGHAPLLLEHIARISKEIATICVGKSDGFARLASAIDFDLRPSLWRCLTQQVVPPFRQAEISASVAALAASEQEDGLKLVSLSTKKREIATKLQEDVRLLAKLRIWLWIHLPVSIALVVCVAVHVFSVFMYR